MIILFLLLTIRNVPATYPTISLAWSASLNRNDTIIIASGTYYENPPSLYNKYGIFVTGDNASNTIVDGQNIDVGMFFQSNNGGLIMADTNLILQDMTWQNGYGGYGGFSVQYCVNTTFRRMIIKHFVGKSYGSCAIQSGTGGAHFENSLFINNSSNYQIGGILINGTGNFYFINNTTFRGSTSPAVINIGGMQLKAYNNIAWSCVGSYVSGAAGDTIWNSDMNGTINITIVDSLKRYPLFIDSSFAVNNFHLKNLPPLSVSPCINAGKDVSSFLTENKDLDKNPIVAPYDIGCYQYILPSTGGILIDVINRRSKM